MDKNRYYVYVYSDPETRKPFYVGKGTRGRVCDHLKFKRARTEKERMIKRILDKGLRPIIEIVQWDLSSKEAEKVEAALIQFIGVDNLTNVVRGTNYVHKVHADFIEYLNRNGRIRTRTNGRRVLLLNANEFYYPGVSRFQLYDAVRGNLHIRERDIDYIDNECELVLVVYDGIVIDVYGNPFCENPDCDMRALSFANDYDTHNITAGEPSTKMRNKYVGKTIDVRFGSRRYLIEDVQF